MSTWFTSIRLPQGLKQSRVRLKKLAQYAGVVIFFSVAIALSVFMLDVGITDSQTPWVVALGAIAASMFIALQQTADRSKHEKRVEEHQKRVEEHQKRIEEHLESILSKR